MNRKINVKPHRRQNPKSKGTHKVRGHTRILPGGNERPQTGGARQNDFEVNPVQETWYHQTSSSAVDNILEGGFVKELGGNQKYGVGIYLMDSPEGSYGEETLTVDVDGDFIDLSDDRLGRKWLELKGSVDWSNYEDLTEKLQKKYPEADGIQLHNVLVVWNLNSIQNIEVKG